MDPSNITVSPKKIFRRQSSKLASITNDSPVKENGQFLLIDDHLDDTKENYKGPSDMEQDSKIRETKCENVLSDPTNQTISNIVAGCRPKIKTKPIIIPKSETKTMAEDQEDFDDIKPLQTRYSYRNVSNIQTDRLSTTLPRNRSYKSSFESNYKQGNIICNYFIR